MRAGEPSAFASSPECTPRPALIDNWPSVRAAAFIAENPRPGGKSFPATRAIPGSLLGARGPDGTTQGETIAAVLGALALLLLVMATANVGNLLLGRAVTREREIAVRLALGMSRMRLVAQVMIESVLLALAATVAAVVVAAWLGVILRSMLMPECDAGDHPV
jgi:hypothetical protein